MSYQPTGYKPGRPRKGEIRPPSPNAIAVAEYRKRRHERDPEWSTKLAEYQANWVANNQDRSREIARDSNRRRKSWEKFENQPDEMVETMKRSLSKAFDRAIQSLVNKP